MLRSLFGRGQASNPIKQIDARQLAELIQTRDDLLLLDVRTAAEYEFDGHIANSQLLPLSLLHGSDVELPRDKTIICICRSGNRSQTAAAYLLSQGFSDVINLSGGMFGWRGSGLPFQ
jgi:rhodanese-related sulfurtransferase